MPTKFTLALEEFWDPRVPSTVYCTVQGRSGRQFLEPRGQPVSRVGRHRGDDPTIQQVSTCNLRRISMKSPSSGNGDPRRSIHVWQDYRVLRERNKPLSIFTKLPPVQLVRGVDRARHHLLRLHQWLP